MMAFRLLSALAIVQLSATPVAATWRLQDEQSCAVVNSYYRKFYFIHRSKEEYALIHDRADHMCSMKKTSSLSWCGWSAWDEDKDLPRCRHYCFAKYCDPAGDEDQCPDHEICCADRGYCVDPETDYDFINFDDPRACGDPHMTGFLGQKFDFTGQDGGWYALIADENMHINMRVTSPVPDLPQITYITGLSVLTTDEDGVDHTIVIEVQDPHNLDSSCPEGVFPCLADGSLRVLADGEETLLSPGVISLGPDVHISAANLPGACRSFGFEKYWERKKLEYATHGRRLGEFMDMGEWILADPTATNMDECTEYIAQVGTEELGVFGHQSEHASFQILTPKGTIRLSHGKLHQLPMRDPTDQFDLPDHLTWQMNMALDHNEVSRGARGILGETFVPTRDANGEPIMTGMEAIRGTEEDYRVEGAVETAFAQIAQNAYTS